MVSCFGLFCFWLRLQKVCERSGFNLDLGNNLIGEVGRINFVETTEMGKTSFHPKLTVLIIHFTQFT